MQPRYPPPRQQPLRGGPPQSGQQQGMPQFRPQYNPAVNSAPSNYPQAPQGSNAQMNTPAKLQPSRNPMENPSVRGPVYGVPNYSTQGRGAMGVVPPQAVNAPNAFPQFQNTPGMGTIPPGPPMGTGAMPQMTNDPNMMVPNNNMQNRYAPPPVPGRGPPKTFSPRTVMPPPTSSDGIRQNLTPPVNAFSQMSLTGRNDAMANAAPPAQKDGGMASNAPSTGVPSGAFNQMEGYSRTAGHNINGPQNTNAPQAPALSEQVMLSQCKPIYMQATVKAIPYSFDQGSKSQLLFGAIIRPLAPPSCEDEEVPVINFGATTGVVRCKRCRTYINPFVQWIDNGRRWKCNVCNSSNDVPSSYFCHLGQDGQRTDRDQRPELCKGSVEIVAPQEYMMRPPQPPVYVFVIDVSANSIQNGVLQAVVETIRTSLDELPGAPRTRVGFLTFDSAVHFYNLKSSLKAPQMMVVSDINELFIPIPDDLLVNLSESRDMVDALLDLLPVLHKNTRNIEVALGPAVRAAFRIMSTVGGKMCVFQTSLPSLGQGTLNHRENPRLLGTEKENTLVSSIDNFYRQNAIEFCRQQVSVDMFLFPNQYMDIATVGCLAKYSAGQLYYYPGFTYASDSKKLKEELGHCLRRETGWEAVLRVRCTQGMRVANYYGNSFLRGPDLLALPNINSDASFAIEIVHSDAVLTSPIISIQAALLYTASCGERRIRVHNLALPVVKLLAEAFRSVDINTLCNLLAKTALETAVKTGFDAARTKLQSHCADIIRGYRLSGVYMSQQLGGYQLNLPDTLQLLPLYTMALMKNPAFRGGTDIRPDERTFLIYQINNMFVDQSCVFIYPRLFSLHNLPAGCGNKSGPETDNIVLPPVLNLSIDRLSSDGAFLLEDGLTLWFWIGRSVDSVFLQSLFGIPSIEGVDCSRLDIVDDPKDDRAKRVRNIIMQLRKERLPFMKLRIIKEGDPAEGRFFWKLVEDRASFNGGSYSYAEFLTHVAKLSMAPPAVAK